MSKTLKIIFLFNLLFTICFHYSFATNDFQESTNASSIQETQNVLEDTSSIDTGSILSNSGVTSVSQLSDYSEANLGLNNILNIILIAIGVLIILFAIAILIRLK